MMPLMRVFAMIGTFGDSRYRLAGCYLYACEPDPSLVIVYLTGDLVKL